MTVTSLLYSVVLNDSSSPRPHDATSQIHSTSDLTATLVRGTSAVLQRSQLACCSVRVIITAR